ncbi:MAG TPA: hypothetical protein VK970_12375 [Candidatus Methylacidiphilales bacterium]|nr:hypothetical protein [Candidatus Methylacidiphilales bacterium]
MVTQRAYGCLQQRQQSQGGSALVIALLLVVLITIMLLGFFATVQMEVAMSRAHLHGIQAGFYTRMGTDAARARLQSALGSTNSGIAWVSAPGRITVANTNIDLFSGYSASTNSADTVNLNPPGLEDMSRYAIAAPHLFVDAANPSMRVRWMYVDKNGAFSTSHSTNSTGRFAFWVDDEGGKVNVNTAWKRGAANTNEAGHPSQVDLETLGFTNPDDIKAGCPFNTVQEARRTALPASAVETNTFQLTAFNHAPELNMFNEPRIILTTQRSLAGGSTNFIDILRVDNSDPGLINNVDGAKVTAQVNRIATLLNRTNWPLPTLAGKSVAQKYAPGGTHQLALNIIEYVRACESPTPVVEPMRGTVTGGIFTFDINPYYNVNQAISLGIAGNNRGPRITEFGFFAASGPTSVTSAGVPYYLVKLKAKIFLPAGFGLSQLDLTQLKSGCVVFYSAGDSISPSGSLAIAATPPSPPPPSNPKTVSGAGVETGSTMLYPGESRVIIHSGYFEAATRSQITIQSIRIVLYSASGARVELIPTRNIGIPYSIDTPAVPEKDITTRSVDDPSINKNFFKDWSVQKANTFKTTHSTTIGTASTITPEQDTDDSRKITDAGMHFPPPKGQPGNLNGIMQSVADLGYVHTGLQTLDNNKAGVPWRTIRLQPQSITTTLPDWVILDLFQVPRQPSETFFVRPKPGNDVNYVSSGGKVNINARIQPFPTELQRPLPLEAVFRNVNDGTGTLSDAAAKSITSAILQQRLADNGSLYGLNAYITPAQLAEVQGVSDAGELSEATLRQTVDLLTTRSGVFSIYAIGQSIREMPNGTIQVLGERCDRTVVERVPDASGVMHFRTVYTEAFNP